MDKSRIFKIIIEAEAEIIALDEALVNCNDDAANWTSLILSGIVQDLQRFVEAEPIPPEIDKQKLSATFQAALKAVGESESRLRRADTALLSLALQDLREIINTTPANVEVPNPSFDVPRQQNAPA